MAGKGPTLNLDMSLEHVKSLRNGNGFTSDTLDSMTMRTKIDNQASIWAATSASKDFFSGFFVYSMFLGSTDDPNFIKHETDKFLETKYHHNGSSKHIILDLFTPEARDKIMCEPEARAVLVLVMGDIWKRALSWVDKSKVLSGGAYEESIALTALNQGNTVYNQLHKKISNQSPALKSFLLRISMQRPIRGLYIPDEAAIQATSEATVNSTALKVETKDTDALSTDSPVIHAILAKFSALEGAVANLKARQGNQQGGHGISQKKRKLNDEVDGGDEVEQQANFIALSNDSIEDRVERLEGRVDKLADYSVEDDNRLLKLDNLMLEPRMKSMGYAMVNKSGIIRAIIKAGDLAIDKDSMPTWINATKEEDIEWSKRDV